MTLARPLATLLCCLALAPVARAGDDVRSPCSLTPVSEDLVSESADGKSLRLDPHKPLAIANWEVRWHRRQRLWVTLAATNRGDVPATIEAEFVANLQSDGGRAGGVAAPPRVIAPHAASRERLALYVPDDTDTVAVLLHARSAGATVAATLSVECSDRRFDAGEMTRPAAALLDEALKAYAASAAEPVANPRQALETVRLQASGAQDVSDVAWAMRYLMTSLNDYGSAIHLAGDPETPAAPTTARPPVVEMSDDGIAVLRLYTVEATLESDLLAYGARLHALMAPAVARRPRGWVIDLRGYGGGDMWAALAALGPVLQGPMVGGFVEHDGRKDWIVERGAVRLAGGKAILDLQLPPQPPFMGPVAVIVGPGTAAAGEAVAVAFEGRPRTRFFGAPTQGRDDTALVRHVLADGTRLDVLGSRNADRNGVVYRGPIEPDKPVARPDAPLPDEVVAWMLEQR